ncbi:MAG: CBS domain-containing protein [Clostridia bacterium]|jgi:CBS domain-containing protein|nr:CBS domain-containing protein [Clostridia bacterium]MBT7123445.1 CBS domain-containing protein [Clostridia bacterium]
MNILFFLKPKVDLAYLDENCTLRQALEKIKHYGFAAVPVIDAKGKYVGTISEGDLLWEVLDKENKDKSGAMKRRVKEIIGGRQHVPVNVNSDIHDLFLKAIEQNFIPVTDDRDMFIGIVTRRDVLKYYYYEEFLKTEQPV